MYSSRLKQVLFFIGLFILLSLPGVSFSAASGYAPAASVTPGAVSTAIKTVITKIGFAPYDAAARIWPAVATGAQIGASAVGSAASSLYSGSAAAVSKMYVPLANGANIAIDLVANIPKAKLAASVLAVMKNPYFVLASIAGTALYDYINSSGLVPSGGSIQQTTYTGTFCFTNGTACKATQALFLAQFQDQYNTVVVHSLSSGFAPCNASGGVGGQLYDNGANWNNFCVQNPVSNLVAATDSDATTKLVNTTPPNPAGVLPNVIDQGQTPDVDPPIATSPTGTTVNTKVTTNPDGSTSQVDTKLNTACSGDTCTVSEQDVTTTKNAGGTVTGTTTTTQPVNAVASAGTIPATTTTQDYSSIIAAVNAASTQAHNDNNVIAQAIAAGTTQAHNDDNVIAQNIASANTQAHNDAVAEQVKDQQIDDDIKAQPGHILNDTPLNPPVPPTITPDTGSYFNFLNTTNPYSWNIASFLPQFPSSGCSYEIHRTIFGRAFDFAPCEKLQPLRTVFAWAFSVLTLWSCFLVIFRSSL